MDPHFITPPVTLPHYHASWIPISSPLPLPSPIIMLHGSPFHHPSRYPPPLSRFMDPHFITPPVTLPHHHASWIPISSPLPLPSPIITLHGSPFHHPSRYPPPSSRFMDPHFITPPVTLPHYHASWIPISSPLPLPSPIITLHGSPFHHPSRYPPPLSRFMDPHCITPPVTLPHHHASWIPISSPLPLPSPIITLHGSPFHHPSRSPPTPTVMFHGSPVQLPITLLQVRSWQVPRLSRTDIVQGVRGGVLL